MNWARGAFGAAKIPTIGLEEEYFICREDDGRLSPALDHDLLALLQQRILTLYPPRHGKKQFHCVQPEAFSCQVELASGVHSDLELIAADFQRMRGELFDAFAAKGLRLEPRGTHPSADWSEVGPPHAGRMPYMQTFAGRRMLTCGFHVHIGFRRNRQLFAFFQLARAFIPLLLALGASSPQWRGVETGSRSSRLSAFASTRHGGVPPQLDAKEFVRFRSSIRIAPVMPDELDQPCWLIRPSIRWPTVEVRVMDSSPDLERNLDIAALLQALAMYSARFFALRGTPQRAVPRQFKRPSRVSPFVTCAEPAWLVADNLWRAEKDGLKADFLFTRDRSDYAPIRVMPLADFSLRWLALLSDDFDRLGCAHRRERLMLAATQAAAR